MAILNELLAPYSIGDFASGYFHKAPFAAPDKAARFRNLISWNLLNQIFESGHSDCWLAEQGRLPSEPSLLTGRLTLEQAARGYSEGRTIFIRHAERAHSALRAIGDDFESAFGCPIDIQIYVTPPGHEGFDWHYDIEDVFVIQSAGEKEFRLRQNRSPLPHYPIVIPNTHEELESHCIGPEVRCLLAAGDWLYIPAGHWHKARASSQSFHLSVGVLSPYAQAQIAQHARTHAHVQTHETRPPQ
jgi:ribosomal protein L16 Arg81 hydroxylase